MSEKLFKVPLEEIDFTDRAFLFSFPTRDVYLFESVKKWGILEPPLLFKFGNAFKILAGEGRLLSARRLGLKEVEAKVLTSLTPKEALLLSLESNRFRKLNLVELAILFEKLSKFFERKDIHPLFQSLGVNLSLKKINLFKSIKQLIPELQLELAEERLNPQVVPFLSKLTPSQQEEFREVLKKLSLSFAEQRDTLEKLIDLTKREERICLLSEKLRAFLAEEDFNRRKQGFMRELFKAYAPFYSESLEKVKRQLEHLKHRAVLYELSPGLEEKELRLKVCVKSWEELEEVLSFLKSKKEEFKRLFELL